MKDDDQKILRKMIVAGLAGDMQALNIILQCVEPALKARTVTVSFELDPNGSSTEQAKQILTAIAAGEVDPYTGKSLLDCLVRHNWGMFGAAA